MSARSQCFEKGRLYFTVGLPHAGKSKWANEWYQYRDNASKLPNRNSVCDIFETYLIGRPRAIVCGDDFRHALYGREYQIEAEPTVFAMMDVAARALISRGHDVLIDETSTTEATLIRYLRIDIGATPIWVDTPKEVCIERAIANGRNYLVGPIERMDAQLKIFRANFEEIRARLVNYLKERSVNDTAI